MLVDNFYDRWHELKLYEGTIIIFLSLALILAVILACRQLRVQKIDGKKSGSRQIPSLLDATADQLITGLEREWFTSSDLVNVSRFVTFQRSSYRVAANSRNRHILLESMM